jgi:GNAT superfamily N-acetyltransferase
LETKRTDSRDLDFQELVLLLDEELAIRDGDDHSFYHQFNGITMLNHVVVCYINGEAVACGAFKPLSEGQVEIKRMYTREEHRGKGYASKVLAALELWASELGYQSCVLETGKAQPEAIALYLKCGYAIIANYGQYAGVENSVCYEKRV